MRMTKRTLLFVDVHDILYRPGVGRVLRPLDRHPQNPVVQDKQTAWEQDLAWCSVYRDPENGLYQLWYQAFTDGKAQKRTHRSMICYAESIDGVNWTKTGSISVTMSNTIFVGMAVSSRSTTSTATVQFRDLVIT